MKKILLFLLITATIIKVQAQISDTDAKLQYQQAQDAYEQGDYFKAWQTADDLEKKMGKPTVKVAYLIIKSIYTGYQVHVVYPKKLSQEYVWASFYTDRCNWLLSQINKATYPADKYKEIRGFQQYFQRMQQQYAYQKERTPEKAVAFLNECAKKFPREDKNEKSTYNFQLSGTILKVSSDIDMKVREAYKRFVGTMYKAEVIGYCQFLDFSKITTLNQDNGDLIGYTIYKDGKKLSDYSLYKYQYESEYNSNKNYLLKKYEKLKKEISNKIENSSLEDVGLTRGAYPIFYYFAVKSPEYINGKYNDRILEAFEYLVDYFPKEKPQQSSNPEQDKSNGF